MPEQVRWAVLNCAFLLRRHSTLHDDLAAAMQRGDSVAQCIALMEDGLARSGYYFGTDTK